MGKFMPDVTLDALLNLIATGTELVVCSTTQPTTFLQASSSYALADVVIDAGDFAIADDTSGRKVTVAAQTAFVIDTSGNAGHICVLSGSSILAITTCTEQALVANASNTVDTPAFKFSISDPT
jgi:hypothetical protein